MLLDFHYLFYVAIPLLLLSLAVQGWVKSAYNKYARVPNRAGISGAECAAGILRDAGIHDVRVEVSQGFLSDHYDPLRKVLRLSPENYRGRSIAAVGIAAHEAGHAVQHATRYAPLALRNAAVPLASIGSNLGYVAIILGFLIGLKGLALVGVLLLAGVVIFQLINLPVEFNASRRALQFLPQMGILTEEENRGARTMLTAAAMTYVAATVSSIVILLYWVFRLGLLGGRD